MSRFTGRQITVMVVAACLAVVAFPVGSVAASALSNVIITDPVHATQRARVTATGGLLVSDGSGAMTVDGTVNARSATQTVALYTGQLLPSNGEATTVATAAYQQIRVSVTNNAAQATPLFVFSQTTATPTSGQIRSQLLNASVPSNTSESFTFQVPGLYTTVATFGAGLDVQVFGRA